MIDVQPQLFMAIDLARRDDGGGRVFSFTVADLGALNRRAQKAL